MKDLAIAYRIYPGISKTPAYHADNKLEMSLFCARSFRRALGSLRFKVWAILDGCPSEYDDLFRSVFAPEELEIIHTPGIGNLQTWSRQIDLLLQQQEAELVMFAEDDYFYRPDAIAEMVDFARSRADADFITPYDHPDSYFTSSMHERHQVVASGKRHWREASSTCLTFITSRRVLRQTESMMKTYSSGNMDCSLWLALTQKTELLRPAIHAADGVRVKIWVKTWIWGWRKILFSRRFRLWSPMPTLSTHMEITGLSPLISWKDEFKQAECCDDNLPVRSGFQNE